MGNESPVFLHRWLLRFYPGAFRRLHGDQILAFWTTQRRESRYATPLFGALRYWLDLLRDAVGNGLRLRRDPGHTDPINLQLSAHQRRPTGRSETATSPTVLGRFDMLRQDLRYAYRSLRGQPLFTIVAIFTLAIGIGSTTAVFSIVDTVLFRPLPYAEPSELMRLGRLSDANALRPLALPEVQALGRLSAFTAVAPAVHGGTYVQWEDSAEILNGVNAGHQLFDVLGVEPIRGRVYTAEEDVVGGPAVILISARVWRRQFAAAENAIGSTLMFKDVPHVIIGIMPDGVDFPEPGMDFWKPFRDAQVIRDLDLNPDSRDITFFNAVARLAPGVSMAAAQNEVRALFRTLNAEEELAADAVRGWAESLHEDTVGGSRTGLLLFLGAVGLVFVVACANVAGLWLTRIAGRSNEIAVRTALGAGRRRIIAQLLTESLALAIVGGLGGIAVAVALQRGLLAIIPSTIPRLDAVTIDGRVLLFALGLALLSAMVFGTLPALRAASRDSADILREGGRGYAASTKTTAQRLLVIGQVAIAVVLLAGAGLFANSYARLVSVELGVHSQGLLLAGLSPALGEDGSEPIRSFYARLLPRLAALPGVDAVAMTYSPPLGQSNFRQSVQTETMADGEDGVWAGNVMISPNYLAVSGVPLLRGRAFTDSDVLGAPNVAIVNEKMAAELWPGGDPLGKRFKWAHGLSGSLDSFDDEFFPDDWLTVVGIAGNVRRVSLAQEPVPEYYRPHAQMSWPSMTVVISTTGQNPTLAADLRSVVADVDPMVPISNVHSLQQNISDSVSEPRFRLLLVGGFALVACLLAMLGVYAVMALTVSCRTHDIGIRMALGAERAAVRRQVVAEGMRMAMLGTGIGLVVALGATQLIAAMLYDVQPTDPLTYAVVLLLTLLVAAVACYLPARRASRLDPLAALRGS